MSFTDNLRASFLKGHYQDCIAQLEDADEYSKSYFLIENNKLVCKCLVSLYCHQILEESFQALLKLYDNFCVQFSNVSSSGPLHVRWTILLNCQWLALQSMCDSRNQMFWDQLLSRIINACHHGWNFLPDESGQNLSWHELLTLFLETVDRLSKEDIQTAGVFLESVTMVILKRLQSSSDQEDGKDALEFVKSVSKDGIDFIARETVRPRRTEHEMPLFKFSLDSKAATLDDTNFEAILYCCAQIGIVLSIRFDKVPSPCFTKDDKIKDSQFWRYCEATINFKKGQLKPALGFLLAGISASSSPLSRNLQCRYQNLMGRIYSEMGERKKALQCFSRSTKLDSNFCPAHYYLGREFGKMGMVDSMIKSYQNLITVSNQQNLITSTNDFEHYMIKILNEPEEIDKSVAMYLLAVAYGINEMFQDSLAEFEKLLTRENLGSIIIAEQCPLLVVPQTIVILHEAATMNLVTGNLARAEEICRQAISLYSSQRSAVAIETDTHASRDLNWIRETLEEEFKMDIDEPTDTETYYEDYLSIFDEDIVGKLILGQLHIKNDSQDEARLVFNQALLLLSKYIARAKSHREDNQRKQETLVKALTCKTCLQIAQMQIHSKPYADVDKMFKRALSCNNGDKDVLYYYTLYLLDSGKAIEADKLWNTFHDKKSIVNAENSQSLALRHLLQTHVPHRLLTGLSIKINKN